MTKAQRRMKFRNGNKKNNTQNEKRCFQVPISHDSTHEGENNKKKRKNIIIKATTTSETELTILQCVVHYYYVKVNVKNIVIFVWISSSIKVQQQYHSIYLYRRSMLFIWMKYTNEIRLFYNYSIHSCWHILSFDFCLKTFPYCLWYVNRFTLDTINSKCSA